MPSETVRTTQRAERAGDHPHLVIVRQCIAWQAARDPRFLDCCAQDVEIDYPLVSPPHPLTLCGKEEIIAYSQEVSAFLPQLEVSDLVVEMLADGSSVLARFLYETPPGRTPVYRSRYCTIARFAEGLIKRYAMYFDPSALPNPGQTRP